MASFVEQFQHLGIRKGVVCEIPARPALSKEPQDRLAVYGRVVDRLELIGRQCRMMERSLWTYGHAMTAFNAPARMGHFYFIGAPAKDLGRTYLGASPALQTLIDVR